MELINNNSDFRLANTIDKPIILNILTNTFNSDPHMTWLLGKSQNKNKLEIMMNYLVDETFKKGKIYITNNNLGVALWHSENKEKLGISFIKRNLRFLIKLGFPTVIRNLKFLSISHSNFEIYSRFYYLLMIGVLPEGRGLGIASKLMNPILEHGKSKNIPIFLETANPINVEIYKKKGFAKTGSIIRDGIEISFMKNDL